MDPVLQYYVYSALILFVLLVIQGGAGTAQVGLKAAAGSRDDLPYPLPGFPGRMTRVVRNHVEGIAVATPIFVAAAFMPTESLASTNALLGAQLFFLGRLAHGILYVIGTPWIRTIAFGISLVGLILMVLAIL
ncbi:MAG: MAPEG family protein [Pseudomonadota bacterium]